MPRMPRSRRAFAAVLLVTLVAGVLAGCVVDDEEMPVPEPTLSPSPGETAAPEPVLMLDRDAAANLPYFNKVNRDLVEQGGSPGGREFIDNLVDAGFPKAAMEVTPDRTSINAEADQIQFSVRINGTCLIGQYGGGKYNGIAAPILSTGTCLIGTTRPIDW